MFFILVSDVGATIGIINHIQNNLSLAFQKQNKKKSLLIISTSPLPPGHPLIYI